MARGGKGGVSRARLDIFATANGGTIGSGQSFSASCTDPNAFFTDTSGNWKIAGTLVGLDVHCVGEAVTEGQDQRGWIRISDMVLPPGLSAPTTWNDADCASYKKYIWSHELHAFSPSDKVDIMFDHATKRIVQPGSRVIVMIKCLDIDAGTLKFYVDWNGTMLI